MTHEIKLLFETAWNWQQLNKKSVLVSVVALKGSSYRRPGVRMLINEDGEYVGAVSGGCIETEIERQAQGVFQSGSAKIMTYDGRLRIGCEGILTILIEPIFLTDELFIAFEGALKARHRFTMNAYYYPEVGEQKNSGTLISIGQQIYSLNGSSGEVKVSDQQNFTQTFQPLFQLYIFGAEHDAVQLCQAAKLLGWEVIIVAPVEEHKTCDYFPGARDLITPAFDEIDTSGIDEQTAVVIMTHSFNKDVQYLLALKHIQPAYLGMIGSMHRRERILSMLIEFDPEISAAFLASIHSPAGINIGAETAAEIAVSILAEILSVVRKQQPLELREKSGSIHG